MSETVEWSPQIITTPAGDRLIVLPEVDYVRLVETAEMVTDIAAFDEAKRRLAAGEDELVPSEIVERLLAGENPIPVWRQHRGLSVHGLAAAASVAQPYLSQIETGKREGSVETLRRIADALRLSIDEITG
jgi:DNA-binding XRE family transcriptional regulator